MTMTMPIWNYIIAQIFIFLCKERSAAALTARMTMPAHSPETCRTKRIVVAGGGVGGLAVASRLASSLTGKIPRMPCEVILLEKNSIDMIGGRCGSFDVHCPNLGTFRHERGPSLLLLKDVYEELFTDCGSTAERQGLITKQCVPAYQVVFDDGDTVELGFPRKNVLESEEYSEAYKKSRENLNSFEVDGARKWDEYMRGMGAFLDCGLPNFIEERLDLPSFPAFVREALRDGGKYWPLKPHSDVLDSAFSSNKMRSLASFQDLYVGLEPYRNDEGGWLGFGGVIRKTAPAVFGLLAALELHSTNHKAGVFAPVGGFRAVGKAFYSLAQECGVDVRFNMTVIEVCEEGVYYRYHNGSENSPIDFMPADLVVVNADLPYATKSLLGRKNHQSGDLLPSAEAYDWDDSFDFSSGVVAFHWALDKRIDGLNTHNVFLVASSRRDAEMSWRVLREKHVGAASAAGSPPRVEPFNFYVHRPVKTDSTAAPGGCDSIMVLVPCKALARDQDFAAMPRQEAIEKYKEQFDSVLVDALRDAVLARLAVVDGLEGLHSHIVHEVVDTPGTYADLYNLGAGVPFGLSHGFGQLSLTRPGAEARDSDRLLYVGASSRPGNGVPLVLIGAKAVAEKALRKLYSLGNADTLLEISKSP